MYYPVNLKIDDMKVVIIGGGTVPYRKCINFLSFNKQVVVSEKFIDEFENIKNEVNIIADSYDKKYIKDAFIVVAATNNKDVNHKIGIYCREHGKLVNVVNDANLSNFIVPSFIKRGDLLLSVSTGGKSPSLSAKIRKDLEVIYDENTTLNIGTIGKSMALVQSVNVMERLLRNTISFVKS